MTNAIIQTIKDIVVILTPVALAIIAYKQSQMSNKQKTIGVQIDGMKTELVEAVKGRAEAEGQLTGMAKAKEEAAVVATTTKTEVQEVKIVEQAKPIDVKIDKTTDKK